ncbi:MAG: sigma 54-interacting transcriptional regulator [Bacteroidetes bacterium]|nr:sigma 54-interacting transcriptional regulator [Bacteroidota bacterium]MBU1679536.1 sigma 54-interacting transcriptional regulator [Bacteroidota bacterium]
MLFNPSEFTEHIKSLNKNQLKAISKLSRALNQFEQKESLIEETLDWVIKIVNAERGLFAKLNYSENKFELVAARNIEEENIGDLSKFSSGILQKTVVDKKALLYHDAQTSPDISKFESIHINKIKSIICVPIFKEKKIWGVILVDSSSNRQDFTQENLLFLEFFGNLVSLTLDKIIDLEKLSTEKLILENKLAENISIPEMIGNSRPMQKLTTMLSKVSKTDATVLILGESGTGKDLAAKAIHNLSSRKDKPFLAQFCGAIPDTLLESELFGYKKGAFTGAAADKKGLLEAAEGGTFFLDEIGDISNALQAKLLRVLENREIIRLGDTNVRKIDVRIITATNQDLQQLVKEGKFREDLFYRLNVFPIKIPTLRDRPGDVTLLANHFIENSEIAEKKLTPSAVRKLEGFTWPGNVRQLFNVIQRALILCEEDKVDADAIIWDEEDDFKIIGGSLKHIEKMVLIDRLEKYAGNKTTIADSLGVSVRWVQLKIKEWNLEK